MVQAMVDEGARHHEPKPFALVAFGGHDVDVVMSIPSEARVADADYCTLVEQAEAHAVALEIDRRSPVALAVGKQLVTYLLHQRPVDPPKLVAFWDGVFPPLVQGKS